MRIALLADIHANLPALEAVLGHDVFRGEPVVDPGADPRRHGEIDGVFHLGDLVGYAPWPNEVVSLLHDRGIPGVAGNYDSTVAVGHDHCGCRYEDPRQAELSHLSYSWTRRHVSARTRRRLRALPFSLDLRVGGGHASGPSIHLFHGAPTLNTLYWHEDRDEAFCLRMAERVGARPGDVLAFGHTHLPWHREIDEIHFVNAGSVGRPKDGDPRACYVVLEMTEEGPQRSVELGDGSEGEGSAEGAARIEGAAGGDGSGTEELGAEESSVDAGGLRVRFIRVEYDVDRAVAGIQESDLPDEFGTILRTGGSLEG